ncbi:uncharacterized protein LOC107367087 [Tetranychus urticae]|uniref:Uncharacterized protein n=1 Tax=Tetranychus urticae TaxID=32264 RepID=T1JQK5_TETUR|nr:uncharacterized protein LOC107367087 [Tetranychus urticae]
MVELGSMSDTSSTGNSPTSTIDSGSTTPSNGSNYSPSGSPLCRRRPLRREDTQTRLFGPPEDSPRRVRNHLKSSVFAENVVDSSPLKSAKKKITIIRRNPITGEVFDDIYSDRVAKVTGYDVIRGENRSLSLPNTPVRTRQPPGGKSSGIFS